MYLLIAVSRRAKIAMLITLDALLCVAAVWISFSLRIGEWELWSSAIAAFGATALVIWLPIFWYFGIYRSIARFIGSRTMMRIATSCCLMMAVLVAIFGFNSISGVPRTVAIIQPLVFGSLLALSRVTIRYVLFDLLNQRRLDGLQNRVLIYGAGTSGRQLASSLRHEPSIVVCGYIDDDARLDGQHLDSMQVYKSSRVEACIDRFGIDTVMLAIPNLSRTQREKIVRSFDGQKVRVLTLPNVQQIVDGKISVSDLRQIEIEDLLGRDPVPPNQLLLHRTVKDKTVMVTGAGGSIGSELCRQIAALNPSSIILVEMTEHALYRIDSELHTAQRSGRLNAGTRIVTELANIADKVSVERLLERWTPDTIFHAAAYKHVPLIEANPIAGISNNVLGTLYCALGAKRHGVRNFILISTDKAVRPTNVMGTTKRVCELILQALAEQSDTTRFSMVRFGNVLGSSGSVVPLFQDQIRLGGPITLTHRDITRYFMTIPEAAQLVVQAGAMSGGGEVFVLNMGDPVRIYDLARTMINLSGLTVRDENNPEGDIEIQEIGLRPGEKLYEELLIGDNPLPTRHPLIMQARERFLAWDALLPLLTLLTERLRVGDSGGAANILKSLVPESMCSGSVEDDVPGVQNAG
ncbi:MAG: nucleoside-diphosphate sugar epimerase/dehydratase [Pseudomonadota bacterium]